MPDITISANADLVLEVEVYRPCPTCGTTTSKRTFFVNDSDPSVGYYDDEQERCEECI